MEEQKKTIRRMKGGNNRSTLVVEIKEWISLGVSGSVKEETADRFEPEGKTVFQLLTRGELFI